MSKVSILMLAMVPCILSRSTEPAPNPPASPVQYPDPLPPEAFEIMFASRFPVFMILEASRYWNTDLQCENFGYLRDKIRDESVDSETKKYAQSILTEATNRLKEVLKKANFEMDDKYDVYDFALEVKNIEKGEPPVHKDLYRMVFKYFWPEEAEKGKKRGN